MRSGMNGGGGLVIAERARPKLRGNERLFAPLPGVFPVELCRLSCNEGLELEQLLLKFTPDEVFDENGNCRDRNGCAGAGG